MGSLRNPVGPLPSSIYWRRRAVALSLAAVLVLLAVWALSSGGGTGDEGGGKGKGGPTPAPSITPGPSQSGPAISSQPGGRDDSGDSGGGEGGDGGEDGGGTAGGDGAGKNGDTTVGGSVGGSEGQQVPANSPIPDCAPGSVQLTLRSLKVSYAPDEKPTFQLVARSTAAAECKADLGPKAAVLTIRDDQDEPVWSSGDCPRGAEHVLLRMPAGKTVTHTVEWDRKRSAAQCATPPAGLLGPGTYLIEAQVPGVKVMPASFTLSKD
ncbi:hypothetical protein ABT160_35620 [Streptomyces sp. NPDC001941]|uniref:hypothetical protein n=1 Tax=Streptomyces sp. NPDC001941 TaxID=3154659 RepID=UPI0033173E55